MSLISGKALWSIICGQSILASDEVVGEELETAASHLKEGLLFYRSWSEDDHKTWCSKSKLKNEQKEFVYKVGKMLEVCSEQAWEIFRLYLQYEFKGSSSQLQIALSSDREETSLLHQVFSFHLSDPLHLLSCRRHILSSDPFHPYEKLFKEFIAKVLDPEHSLGTKLVSQLKKINLRETSPAKLGTTVSPHLPVNAAQARISYRLSAIKHQLATLLVYHGSPGNPCPPEAVCSLFQLAQGIGLGRDMLESVRLGESSSFLSQLEAIDAFHSFLLTLVINADSDPRNHPLCVPEWVSRLNVLIHSLGSKPWHFPPILAWGILQGRRVACDPSASADEAAKYSHLVQRAIRGNVFHYLQSTLKITAFETDHLLLVIGGSITYSLICIVGTCLDLDKVGLLLQAQQLAKVCLQFEPTSHFFWNEEGGGASVLLPSALEVFPHNASVLIGMMTSLASANKFSAGKVVELMKDLESFTWPLTMTDAPSVSASGSQCIAREALCPLPGFTIPKDTHGTILNTKALASAAESPLIVCWKMSTDGWRVFLGSFTLLLNQIDSGGIAEEWCMEIVIGGLRLLSSLLRADPQQSFAFQDLQNVAQHLFISVSQLLKPEYELISALLEYFSQVSKVNCSALWNELDGCSLLSSLPITKMASTTSSKRDFLYNYRAGNIRALICGIEANTGSFDVLRHLCALVETALQNGRRHMSVRGTVVFVVKEVVPVMLLWRCPHISSRIQVIEATFSLLHHVLEDDCVDKELQELVVGELSNAKGGAGATLRSVLESSANLQATLDQPAEWPHSSHARKLTKMAKLALSLAHRLVGQYLTSSERLRQFFLEDGSDSRHTSMSHGVWVTPRPTHLALIIAHFVHHRLNPRLPYLALKTLTRLAKEIGVPLVACLGTEAEGLRDCLLGRLDSATEDLWVKVALLRLLTLSTLHQPGLIRLFLTPPKALLDSLVVLTQQHKKSKTEAGTELLLAVVELVSSLWGNNLGTATAYLRGKALFWDGLSYCLCNDAPGNINDDVIGGIFKVYSLEYFGSENEACEFLRKNMQIFFDASSEKFSTWIKYVFGTYIENGLKPASDGTSSARIAREGANNELLENCCQFLVVVLTRSPNLLTEEQKSMVCIAVAESLLSLFECDGPTNKRLQLLLSEVHLLLICKCGRVMSSNRNYASVLCQLLGSLRSSVMQTSAQCQVMVLAGTLKALCHASEEHTLELSSGLVSAAMLLVEQHCSLSSSHREDREDSMYFSSAACLTLSCVLLYQCLQPLPQEKTEELLAQSPIVYSLLQASVRFTEMGNSSVVREIQRLLTHIARRGLKHFSDLNTESLASSVSLVLSSQQKLDLSILRDVLWCATFCLRNEGSAGLEGAVSLAAVHLPALTAALAAPDTQADLALAAAALAASLAPYHQLWRVLHQECFEQMVLSTAACIHRSVKMLNLKETLEREVCGDRIDAEKPVGEGSSPPLSACTVSLINQLLQILSTCLGVIRCLSPDITELLCCPGTDLTCTFDLIQPSIRRQTGNQMTLPNFATLADVLDLYHMLVPKDGRFGSPTRNAQPIIKIDLTYLMKCAEEALYLFLTYSALLIMSPDVPARDTRDIKTFLADETSSFFGHWSGRRTVPSSSSMPPLSPKLPVPNLPYFMLCRQIVTSLCNRKTN